MKLSGFGLSNVGDDMIAGAIAGAVSRTVSAPFDVVKIRDQLQFTRQPSFSPLQMFYSFRNVVRDEGVTALWKGNLSATFLWVSYTMVQFAVFGAVKRWIDSGAAGDIHNGIERGVAKLKSSSLLFMAGSLAGATATTATYPFDVMRTQFVMQGKTRVYNSMLGFAMDTIRKRGVGALYAGLSPALVTIVPASGMNFAVYESLKSLSDIYDSYTGRTSSNFQVTKKAIFGGLAGSISKLIVYPLDTVKKRLQMQSVQSTVHHGAIPIPQYLGIRHCCTQIIRDEGFSSLYKGLAPSLAKSALASGITFAMFEFTRDFLNARRLGQKHI